MEHVNPACVMGGAYSIRACKSCAGSATHAMNQVPELCTMLGGIHGMYMHGENVEQ